MKYIKVSYICFAVILLALLLSTIISLVFIPSKPLLIPSLAFCGVFMLYGLGWMEHEDKLWFFHYKQIKSKFQGGK